MTYKEQQDDRITLEMKRSEYLQLVWILGYAVVAACQAGEFADAREWMRFANELSESNPNWSRYDIPPENVLARLIERHNQNIDEKISKEDR